MSISAMSTTKVESINPGFSPDPNSNMANQAPNSRPRNVLTIAGIAVVGAAAFAVGTLVGGGSNAQASTSTQATSAATASDSAVISSIVAGQPSLNSIGFTTANELVSLYESNPSAWDNAFVPEAYVKAASNLRTEEAPTTDKPATRLLRSEHGEHASRNLVGVYNIELASAAYDASFDPSTAPRIEYENDAAKVELGADNRCLITFDDSTTLSDWLDNLSVGNQPLLSVKEYTEAHASCPTSTCTERRVLGQAYKGFLVAWNNMSVRVWDRMVSECNGASEYLFTGYSRAGSIAAQAAVGFYLEGLLPASKIKLVTFAMPRALSKELSDKVHNKFEQVRFVYGGDPIPALPPGAFDLKHFGELRCFECNYNEDRDRPYWPNLFLSAYHTAYKNKEMFYPKLNQIV